MLPTFTVLELKIKPATSPYPPPAPPYFTIDLHYTASGRDFEMGRGKGT